MKKSFRFPYKEIRKGKIRMLDLPNKDMVLPFKAISGGRDGEGPWILNQPLGAMIVVQDDDPSNRKDFNGGVFTILHKTDKTVRLVNPQAHIDTRVIANRFCNRYSLVEVLCIVDLDTVLEDPLNEDIDNSNTKDT